MNFIKKNYFCINITFFLIMIYALSIPYTGHIIKKYTPIKNLCSYRAVTKKNCPFCGITTDFKHIYLSRNLNIEKNNPISTVAFSIFCLEIIFRTILVFFRKNISIVIILSDIFIHLIFFLCILGWIIFFFI